MDGKTLILRDIPISMKVKDLLQRLASEKHIEIEYYGFNYGGKPLKDGMMRYQSLLIPCLIDIYRSQFT